MIVAVSFVIVTLYSVIAIASATYVHRFQTVTDDQSTDYTYPAVTVVVAARNEEDSLAACLDALLSQEYPEDIEIIVVDDSSTDGTVACAQQYSHRGIVVCSTSETDSRLTGKARPLDLGFMSATNEWIATTDADCRPPSTWLKGLIDRTIAQPDKDMVCGCTVVKPYNAASQIQRLDWLHLLCIAAGLSTAGLPLTAMGNNMLLRKSAYERLGGYSGIGDSLTEDFHLFQAFGDKAEIVPIANAANVTVGEESFGKLFLQKQRWLAGGLKAPVWVWLLYLTFALCHVAIIATTLFVPLVGVVLLLCKMFVDAGLILTLSRRLETRVKWRWFIPFQLYQLSGVVLVPTLLLLRRGVDWRGRSHRIGAHSSVTS